MQDNRVRKPFLVGFAYVVILLVAAVLILRSVSLLVLTYSREWPTPSGVPSALGNIAFGGSLVWLSSRAERRTPRSRWVFLACVGLLYLYVLLYWFLWAQVPTDGQEAAARRLFEALTKTGLLVLLVLLFLSKKVKVYFGR